MNTRTTAWLTLAAALLALLGAACSAPAVEWSSAPAVSDWVGSFRAPLSAESVERILNQQHEAVLKERTWCRANAGLLPDGPPLSVFNEEASARDLARFFEPIGEAELQLVGELAEIVARERELPLNPLPEVRLISHEHLRTVACHALLHEDQIGGASDLWLFERALGINHQDWTPSVFAALWAYGVGGWYSLDTKTVTLVGGQPFAPLTFNLIAHELIHAIQDQYLEDGIGGLYEEATNDQATAIAWLIEGDAVTADSVTSSAEAMELVNSYQWGPQGTWTADRNGLSPYIAPLFGQGFDSQYSDGAEYVGRQKEAGGWQRVNELLADPPQSSEQVMHPEKLAAREPPIDPERLAELRRRVFGPREEPSTTTMGESYLGNFLGLATQQPQRSAQAAAGWGGDELAVWSMVDGRRDTTAIWVLAFDNESEHREGVEGLREWLIAWSGRTAVYDPSRRALAYDGQSAAIRVVEAAQTAWLVVSEDRATADQITRNLLRLNAAPNWWNSPSTPRE